MPNVEPSSNPPGEFPTAHDGLPLITPDFIEQDEPEQMDNVVPTRGYATLPMVGLGGSAGGIPALRQFFEAMPADSGMVFVVILHLAPDHHSILSELLGRVTTMNVQTALENQTVTANTVYVIPPGRHLVAHQGQLRLVQIDEPRGHRVAVDMFFRSLADSHGPHAAAIVLSGADGDGAIGIKRIKERGGLTVAQDPAEAEHASMPRAAIDTQMVDWVLPVAAMPARLMAYRDAEAALRLPPEEGPQPARARPVAADENEQALHDVLVHLRTRTGRDFAYYKRATIVRRIARRMQVNGTPTLPEYLDYLRTHPGEAGALQQELLVSVTNFFRDRDAFRSLEEMMPAIFADKGMADTLRVWVPACATGEEAYSVAMLLLERSGEMDAPPTIQIFATDLDEDVIAAAREGFYPTSIAADVSEERLRRFFVREHHGYRVRREIRETVLFAVHDMLKDAPFSRLDLVTCRNLLIYLDEEAQDRALDVFHFVLRPEGRLFLGSSETAGDDSSLFTTLNKRYRLYQRRATLRKALPAAFNQGALTRSVVARSRAAHGPFLHGRAFVQPTVETLTREAAEVEGRRVTWEELHFRLIERLAPPSVVVTRDYEIVHISANASRYLRFAGGEPSMNLLKVVPPTLRTALRVALFRAAQTGEMVEAFRVPVELEGELVAVDLRVTPAPDLAPDFLLVTFAARAPGETAVLTVQKESEPAVNHLERENDQMKGRLRETVEQYEAAVEELKAGNEELQAMNEELRSSGEELETSREELQSINEELTTVNQELKGKVEELAHANADLANLMAATGVATIFLDRTLRITRYTPSAVNLFRLIPTDTGRPLTDLTHGLNYPDLREDAESVLETLVSVRRQVSDVEGRWFLVQLLPYRAADDRIAGVVLSFVNITDRRRGEEALAASREQLRLIVDNAREYAIVSLDLERRVMSWNPGAELIMGYTAAEVMGQPLDLIFTPADRAAGQPEEEARRALAEGHASDERWMLRKDGSRYYAQGVLMRMNDARGEAIGLVKICRDQTAELKTREALTRHQEELLAALREAQTARAEAVAAGRAKDEFLAALSHELRTPLTPVLMAARTLAKRQDLPPTVTEALAMISRNVQIEAHFIDDLLDLTRLSHGKLELVRAPVDLHEVIRRAVEICEADFTDKRLRLTIALEAPEARMDGDVTRLQQVVWNLLKNAAKFTPEHGKVSLRTRAGEPGRIVLEIIDSGIGMGPGVVNRIFNPFEQADPAIARQFGGLGLGLAISKAVVDGHGGTILATSPGFDQGATFTVDLPLLPGE